MVMATSSLCQPYDTGDLSHEAARTGSARDAAAADAAALHERLVAYVHALAPPHEARSGVWVEHSYARARGAAHAPASHVRVLLAPPADPPADALDVERVDPAPPSPPSPPDASGREREPSDTDADDDEDDWEPRVTALAPGAAHAELAESALDALRRLRLARLAGGRAHEHVRAAARRLRHALAAAAAAPGPPAQRPAPWLHAALLAYTPRAVRRLYDEVTAELRRTAPRLAARLAGAGAAAGRAAGRGAGAGPGAARGPWLVWLGGGSERQDRRWRRRLGALLHTRVLPAPAPAAAAPEAWCAAVAGAMRTALADTLVEAGDRAVIVGGAGMGASLCVALAGGAATPGAGARVRGLLLLGLPLLTAEGPRDSPEDPLAEVRLPLLLVAGTGAADSSRGAVRAVARAREGERRRVLEVRGADAALRLPAAVRRRRRLPQHALDAAVAEECARWALETAEGADGASPPRSPPRARRRAAPAAPAAPAAHHDDDEEYAHLPAAAARQERPSEIANETPIRRDGPAVSVCEGRVSVCEGRVVSRGSGATPLALLPPRRAGAGAPASLAAADIMRLPIVFADDEGVAPARSPSAEREAPDADSVTVTSGAGAGAGPYARVIVASRGSRGGRGAGRGARGTRPLLLRRAVRLVPRSGPH